MPWGRPPQLYRAGQQWLIPFQRDAGRGLHQVQGGTGPLTCRLSALLDQKPARPRRSASETYADRAAGQQPGAARVLESAQAFAGRHDASRAKLQADPHE